MICPSVGVMDCKKDVNSDALTPHRSLDSCDSAVHAGKCTASAPSVSRSGSHTHTPLEMGMAIIVSCRNDAR